MNILGDSLLLNVRASTCNVLHKFSVINCFLICFHIQNPIMFLQIVVFFPVSKLCFLIFGAKLLCSFLDPYLLIFFYYCRFVMNALKAKEFYKRDVQYIVRDGKALIINEVRVDLASTEFIVLFHKLT